MSPALTSHFADYASFHRTPGNQACHYLGIPLIVLTLFTFLSAVPLLDAGGLTLTLAELVLAGVVIYYFSLDAALGAVMLFAVMHLARGVARFQGALAKHLLVHSG